MKNKLIIFFARTLVSLAIVSIGYAAGYVDRSAKYGDSLNLQYEFKSCSQDK